MVDVNGGKLVLHDGMIKEHGSRYGGGVSISNGTFIMNGGSIKGNNSGEMGGGIYLINNSKFTMNNGTISSNTAGTTGGALFTGLGSTFTMNGGEIVDNIANNGSGGGVKFDLNTGDCTINNGLIARNKSSLSGGGIGIHQYCSTITYNGGNIEDNTPNNVGDDYSHFVNKSGLPNP
ncbi:hypothetical protein FACS1894190_17590 [Spirochaetia bacterium]|nr:hypothetical protein FACS1894190_17590 [Spirochaetia bacterium]